MVHEVITGLLALCLGVKVCPTPVNKSAHDAEIESGLVIESIVKGRQAERSGMRSGDIIYGWISAGSKHLFASPFDPPYIAVEQASRASVTVYGTSGGRNRTWTFNSDSWGFYARPNFTRSRLVAYKEAMRLADSGNAVDAVKLLETGAGNPTGETSWLAPWFRARAARLLIHAEKWRESNFQLQQALQLSSKESPIVRVELLRLLGSSLEFRGDLAEAGGIYRDMLQESQGLDPHGMEVANSLLMLASIEQQQDDLEHATVHLTEGLNIAQRVAPKSFQTAAIFEQLGILSESQNDLENAQRYYSEALRIEERYFPDSRQLANTLTNLGTLAHWRRDFERAEAYHRQALNIAEKVEGNDPQIAEILNNLGDCILEQGHPEKADRYQRRALKLQQRTAPGTVAVALTLASLAEIARIHHDFQRAEEYFEQALDAATNANAPEADMIRLFAGQADVFRDKEDYFKAEAFYRRALAIVAKVSPGSMDHAEILAELAGVQSHQGLVQPAMTLYREALAMIEARAAHLGGLDEDRSRYRASNIRYYGAYSDVLLQQGRLAEAFEVIEGSRARTLLELLARIRIKMDKAADRSLLKRLGDLRRAVQDKAETRIRLAASEHATEQLAHLDSELDALLIQQNDTESQIRLSVPEYMALTEPKQLSLVDIRKLLDDEETLLLEYSLHEGTSHVWAVTGRELVVFDLLPKSQIETAAREYHRILAAGPNPARASAKPQRSEHYDRSGWRLSQMLLRPVAQILGKKRLIIVADGALQYIPFAALPDPRKPSRSIPLIVQHEVINLPSASVLAEIRHRQLTDLKVQGGLAVLADPVFDPKDERVTHQKIISEQRRSSNVRNDLTRSVNDLGLNGIGHTYLDRLLYTRKEADAVMASFPPEKTFRALDFNASRSTAIGGVLAKYRIVHFATHGLLNNKHPELSGLVLSLVNEKGERQDGFLKLQDIYDLKLHADLVVLSGCETALGQQVDGEGLVGLTRGFMYAGANRVIASLWSVSDLATADLMAELYKNIQAGISPAAALRAAQISMWKQPQWNSAYYWASFQIQGDWR